MVHPAEQFGAFSGLVSSGYAAVSFFFMLSGLILTYTYGEAFERGEVPFRRFLIARLARIYPVYLVCTLMAAWVYRSQLHPAYHALALLGDIFLLQAWSIRITSFFNVPGWSLSAEAFFYVMFPFLVLRIRKARRSHLMILFGLLWCAAMVVPVLGTCIDPVGGLRETAGGGHNLVFAIRRYPIFFLPVFAAGVALGWFHLRFRLSTVRAQGLLFCGLVLTLVLLWNSARLPFLLLHNGLLLPLYAAIILGLCYPGPLGRSLSSKPMLILGETSYAMYLFHYQYNDLVKNTFHLPESVTGLFWRLLVIIPASVALYFGVERPCRKLILRMSRPRGVKIPSAQLAGM